MLITIIESNSTGWYSQTEEMTEFTGRVVQFYRADGLLQPEYTNVSVKVVKIIQSYTGVVDKMVWRKY